MTYSSVKWVIKPDKVILDLLVLLDTNKSLIIVVNNHCHSIEPMWPVSKDAELREDIQVLIKFWQAMHSDKKYMKYFMVSSPVDAGQLLPHTSSSSSQYTSGSSSLGPYLQVQFMSLSKGTFWGLIYM